MSRVTDFLFGAPATLETRAEEPIPAQDAPNILPPSRSASPRGVTTDEAFGMSMVYRAINIHAVSGKQLSFTTYKDGNVIDAPSFIKRPNIDQSRSAFVEETIVSLASNGNAYWLIERDNQNRVTNLTVLNPLEVEVETDSRNRVTKFMWQGKDRKPGDIQHLKLLRVPGRGKGLGPIQAAQVELRGAMDTQKYANNWFETSGVPHGVLKSDQVLSPEQAAQAKESFQNNVSGGVAVLGNGLNYTPVYLSPEDAQFIQNQQFNITQVARLFGVPSSLMLAMVEGNSQTYANVEQDWIGYVRFSLMSYLVEIEDAFTALLPGRTEAKFNVDALLRTDTKTRYEAHKIAKEAGFLTVDEIREIENLPPLPKSAQPTPVPATEPVEDVTNE